MIRLHAYKLVFSIACVASLFLILSRSPAGERSKPGSTRKGDRIPEGIPLLDAIFGGTDSSGSKKNPDRGGMPSTPDDLFQAVTGMAAKVVEIADDQLPDLPPETSRSLGDRYRRTLVAKHRELHVHRHKELVHRLWNELLMAASLDRDAFRLTLTDDKSVNAFAFVGNNVVVTRGFLDFADAAADREGMIRFVLAHELGHIVLKHTEAPFRRSAFVNGVMPGSGIAPDLLSRLIGESALNQSSELACDCFARKLLLENNWSTDGGVEFFKAATRTSRPPRADEVVAALFRSHPDDMKRADNIRTGRLCQ